MGRCYVCGKALTTPESVAAGIGPVCAAKRALEMKPESTEGKKFCAYGFSCYNPEHVETLAGRLARDRVVWVTAFAESGAGQDQVDALTRQTGNLWARLQRIRTTLGIGAGPEHIAEPTCPHKLSCKGGQAVVDDIYAALATMRHEIDPMLQAVKLSIGDLTPRAYRHLGNMLEVLGKDSEAELVHKESEEHGRRRSTGRQANRLL